MFRKLYGVLIIFLLVTPIFVSRAHALTSPFTYYGKTMSVFGMFGQKNVGSATENNVSGATQKHAAGVVVDTSVSPNRVYVVDSGNSRILGYSGIGKCSNNTTLTCTVNADCGTGNSCNVPAQTLNPKQADIIIGQPDAKSGACNGDNNLGWNKAPTASTLCLIAYPWGNNTAEQWGADNIDVDSQGNLYVSDIYNNRVLKYNQPFSTDKTGGKGDSVADFVWGQNDFVTNGRNRGSNNGWTNVSPPDDHSLWFVTVGPKCHGDGNPAVSVDPSGNVWVSDTCNHRILRFPPASKNANLVIGQTDFISNTEDCTGASMNKFCGTMQARINPSTGELYIMDRFNVTVPFRSRILVYRTPFTNGESAYKTIVPKGVNFTNWGGWDGTGAYYYQGSGFTFNKDLTDYPTGLLWATEHDGNRVLLVDASGNVIKIINATSLDKRGGTIPQGCPYYYDNGNGTGYGLFWPSSAVSFDSANNIYITAEEYSTSSHIVRFSLPYNTTVNSSGVTCLPLPNGGLNWEAPLSNDTIAGANGLTLYGNQLVSLHLQGYQNVYGGNYSGLKMMAWNDYPSSAYGASANFVITNSIMAKNINYQSVDDKGRLWAINHDIQLIMYQLPFTSSTPSPLVNYQYGANPFYWADDNTQVNTSLTGFTFDPVHKVMYAVDHSSRILRIKNYDQYTGHLLVDMVIGQKDKTNVACNQGLSAPNAGTLCQVRQIKFDTLGNLYAVDNDYECHGNRRITMFTAADLAAATGMFPNLQAKKVFNEPDFTTTANCAYWVHDAPGSPVTIAFNGKNQMVVGNDGYYDQAYDSQRELKQLWFYANPVNKQTPDATINMYMGTPGEMAFDASDNLIIQDGTWNRMQLINLCKDPQWLTFAAGITPVSACSPVAKPGDANGDGKVDETDYSIWLSHYGQAISGIANGDFNMDNKVDGIDYAIWLKNYGS